MDQLPITEHLNRIVDLVADNRTTVLVAPTGSGKSSMVPATIYQQTGRKVISTAPTVPAARSLATCVQHFWPQLRIGFAAGGHNRYRASHHPVTYVTAGHLKQVLAHTGDLPRGYDILVLDEAHTVSADYELLVALLRTHWDTIVAKSPNFRLVISSATIDTAQMARMWPDAPIYQIEVPMYAVTESWSQHDFDLSDSKGLASGITKHIVEQNAIADPGHILVFLSGQQTIDAVWTLLFNEPSLANCAVFVVHAAMPHEQIDEAYAQQVAFDTSYRAIILSTDISETAVTIPGVVLVVDGGLQKLIQVESGADGLEQLTVLTEQRCSKFAATQRRGRTGRTGPGHVHRMYTESTYINDMDASYPCELGRTPLHVPVLQLLSAGCCPQAVLSNSALAQGSVDAVKARVRQTVAELASNGMIEASAAAAQPRLTPLASFVAQLPVSIPLGRVLYAIRDASDLDQFVVTLLVALVHGAAPLSWIPRRNSNERPDDYSKRVADHRTRYYDDIEQDSPSGVHTSLALMVELVILGQHGGSTGKWSTEHGLNNKTVGRVHQLFTRLSKGNPAIRRAIALASETTANTTLKLIGASLDATMPILQSVFTTFRVDSKERWCASEDADMFYRLDRRGFRGTYDPLPGDGVVGLHRAHVRKPGRPILGFLSMYLPLWRYNK